MHTTVLRNYLIVNQTASMKCKIVISGISGSFPESRSVQEFRENLYAKNELVNNNDGRNTKVHPEICDFVGKMHDLEKFDAGFFGLHHSQIDTMDPMVRVLLEKSVEAIFDAGVNPKDLEGSKTGVFVGVCSDGSEQTVVRQNLVPNCLEALNCLKSSLPNRVSYFLKLHGPSCAIDTACSSSIFALEHAIRAIRNGDCDQAIVGACNLCLDPFVSLQFSRLGLVNNDGKCKSFDESADGYTRSEACIVLFVRKEQEAKRTYCEIVHIKTNGDGYKQEGITYPSSQDQEILMREAYQECGIDPNEVSYFEAHGPGTSMGDTEELKAVSKVLLKERDRPLLIGSVKSNMGHSEPASGLASISKVIIAMETGLIPPNLHYKSPRKEVEGLHNGDFKVVTEATPFEDERVLVAVSNFGFGGANSHTLLRWNPKTKIDGGKPKNDVPRLVCVSGRTKEAIYTILDDINARSLDAEYIGLFHEIFETHVPGQNYRGFSVISQNGELERSVHFMGNKANTPKYLVFSVFEKQWKDIVSDLRNLELFKTSLDKIERVLSKIGLVLEDDFYVENHSKLNIMGSTILQLALVDTLRGLNLVFDGVFSSDESDEIACYYYDGLMTLEQCLSSFSMKNSKLACSHDIGKHDFNSDNAVIVKIGTKRVQLEVNNNDVMDLSCGNLQEFVESVGKLYELGQNPTIFKLYSRIEFPVSRGTPMISHLIKWDHSKDWSVMQCKSFKSADNKSALNRIISLDLEIAKGHVIDGVITFPTSGYLYLVWKTFAQNHGMKPDDSPVVFENCEFMHVVNDDNEVPVISVMIQKGSGVFEITQGDDIVASGLIRLPISDKELEVIDQPADDDVFKNTSKFSDRDFYKELRLRGQNYNEGFRGVIECNLSFTKAKIRWEQNWVTFLDCIFQVKFLLEHTRLLKVPNVIKQLIINPKKHSSDKYTEIPVFFNKQFNIINSAAVQIRGLSVASIPRKQSESNKPSIEKYQFIPNLTKLTLRESAKVNSQIVVENLLYSKIKVVELVDEATDMQSKLLSPVIHDVLNNIPLIQSECSILTKRTDLEKVQNVDILQDNFLSETDCSLVIISGGFQRPDILRQALRVLKPNGFVISREHLDSSLNHKLQIDIITEHTTGEEKIVLLREKINVTIISNVIDITSAMNFSWITVLKTNLRNNEPVILLSRDRNDGIIGLINCLRREENGDKAICVFMQDTNAPPFDQKLPFYINQIKMGLTSNVFTDGVWGSYCHLDLEKVMDIETDHSYLTTLKRGDLSSLKWVQGPLRVTDLLEGNQELIHIYYASLNFTDVMNATDLRVDFLKKDRLSQDVVEGIEFSGKTSNGKRVFGLVNGGALSNLVAADRDMLLEIPEEWSMEEAATVLTVYSTVIYALLIVTRIKLGDKILIHSGAGGIGLSAITLALHHGCEVFTTVSSEVKRDFLRRQFPQLDDDHIGSSKDTSFVDMVHARTNGLGVDFVLNSLIEEKSEASVRCLADGGHFLEIGKSDISTKKPLQLLLLSKEASFHEITMDSVFSGTIERKLEIVKALRENIANGAVKPIVKKIFESDQAEEAFRYMTTGKHIGKVLIQIRPEENVSRDLLIAPSPKIIKALPKYWCNSKKSYVLIGGLGGFGMELADWLILRGARRLVLNSRRGITTGYQTYRINIWKSYGVKVEVDTNDVSSKSGCETILKKASMVGSIDGIFNLAMVLKDATFANQTPETFAECAKPKSDATRNLDELSRRLCPDLKSFVVFSSLTCGRGNAGQTNYGMANSVMERICETRRRDGLPSLAIQWGPIGEVGFLAETLVENIELGIKGTHQQKISDCLQQLDQFFSQSNVIVSSMIVADKSKGVKTGTVLDIVGNIIGIKDLKTVCHHATLPELGMDSLNSIEIKKALESEYGIFLTVNELRCMTLDKLNDIRNSEATKEP